MIPVLLTIQGLYSYRKKQVIDFNKLISAQIFGIFGGVGSGKSSILEAISFALYYQSERLNKQDNRSYNMMNLKSDEFLIDFVFTAGSDKQEYRIKIETSRRKNKDEVKPFTRSTYKKEANEWIATELDIEELVGLSYENFKRTIIIPQGKFQEFLELKDSERVKMMKDIFQLDKFDLSDQVASLISENKQVSENVKGQMFSLENVSHETIQELKVQKKNTETEYKGFQEKLKTGRQSLQHLEKLKELNDLLNAKKIQFKKLSEQESRINQQEKTLAQYQKLYRLFQFDLTNQKHLQTQQVEAQHKIKQSQLNYEQLQEKHQQVTASFEKVEADYSNRDIKLRQAEEMETYLQAKAVQKTLKSSQKEEADSRTEFDTLLEAVRKAEENEEVLKKQLSTLSQDSSQKNELYQIKSWLEQEKLVLKSLNDVLIEKDKNEALQIQLRNELAAKLLKLDLGWKTVEEIPDHFEEFSLYIKDHIANFQKQYELFQAEIAKINTHLKLEAYAQSLKEGEPCPLCGSEHHPDILEGENSHEKLQEIQQQSKQIEEKISQLNELTLQVSRHYQNIDIVCQKLIELKGKIEQSRSEHALMKTGFAWPEYKKMALEEVDAKLHKLLEIEKEEKNVAANIEKYRQQQKDHRNTLQHKQIRLQQLAQENASLITKVETLFQSLKNLKVEKAETMGEALIQEKVQEIRNWYQQIGQQYKASELLLNNVTNELNTRKGEIAILIQRESEVSAELNKLSITISDKLKLENLSVEEVNQVLAIALEESKLQKEISEFRQNLYAAKEAILELEKQSQGNDFDSANYEKLVIEVAQLEQGAKQCHESLIRLEKEVSDLTIQMQRKEELQKRLDELLMRSDNLRTMASLFRTSGFVNYISSKFLVNLCNAANDKFYKLTRQQLRLEISDNNDFQIRDYLNNGKVRSIKTLSGGQTFQASLCLALALADSVQQQNKSRQNFFFLDEGFGSQDKDSLRLVFDTLKALRTENRIVGIISHVEELQQEVGVHLKIENTEEEGSIIVENVF